MYMDLSESKRNRLVKFMQAFTILGPSSSLELPGMELQYYDFMLADDDLHKEILYWVKDSPMLSIMVIRVARLASPIS